MEEMNGRAEELGQIIIDEGHRLTTARRIVLETLVECDGHLSADELTSAVRIRHEGIGRMTVYRTLDLLCELGLIRPIYQGFRAARFVLLTDGRHHHFVCSKCDQVIEIDNCLIEELDPRLGGGIGFEVRAHLLEVVGICNSCRE